MEMDALSRAYVIAGLRIGREVDGFVDSYYGPDELAGEAREISDPDEALDRVAPLLDEAGSPARQEFFSAQLRAMRTTVALQRGEAMPYLDEVEATFGIRPEWTDESVFEAAQQQLDELLPGTGSITERRREYRQRFELETSRILPLAESLQGDLRRRTMEIIELPEGEQAEILLVSDKPWSGYNWYLGNLRSRIEINTDLPVLAHRLPELIAHEIYCGHHTEHVYKEQHWLRERGFGEAAISLLTSPQAVISEGIATVALDQLVPETERADWLARHCFDPAGLDLDAETDIAIQQASADLRRVDGNAALMIHQRGASAAEAVEYLKRYGLKTDDEARQTVRFVTTPILRGYIFSYTAGYDLVSRYLESSDDRAVALPALYSEHWTPGLLRERTSGPSGTG